MSAVNFLIGSFDVSICFVKLIKSVNRSFLCCNRERACEAKSPAGHEDEDDCTIQMAKAKNKKRQEKRYRESETNYINQKRKEKNNEKKNKKAN